MKIAALVLLALSAIAVRAESSLRELMDQVVRRPAYTMHPDLPVLSAKVRAGAEAEMAADAEVKEAMRLLSVERSNVDRFRGVELLARKRAVWCLQATLCDPRGDMRSEALRALRKIGDPRAVRFLIIFADKMAVTVMGSECATIHSITIRELGATLAALTGVKIKLVGPQDVGELRRVMQRSAEWLMEYEKM